MRSNLLSIFQENALLLHPTDECVKSSFGTFLGLVDTRRSSREVPQWLRCEALIAITTILIEKEAIIHFPRLLEQFTERLYNAIIGVNSPEDVLLRQCALDCLRELELEYPGLLHEFVFDVLHTRSPLNIEGLLYSLCVSEQSHIRERYLALFVTCVNHATTKEFLAESQRKLREQEQAERESEEREAGKRRTAPREQQKTTQFFEIAPKIISLYEAELARAEEGTAVPLPGLDKLSVTSHVTPFSAEGDDDYSVFSPKVQDKLVRCVSIILEEAGYLTEWGLNEIVLMLAPLVRLITFKQTGPSPLPVLQFQDQVLSSVVLKNSPLLMHTFCAFARNPTPGVLIDPSEVMRAARQLSLRVNDSTVPVGVRVMYVHMLSSLLHTVKPHMRFTPRVHSAPFSAAPGEFAVTVLEDHFGVDRAGKASEGSSDEGDGSFSIARRGIDDGNNDKEEAHFDPDNTLFAAVLAVQLYPTGFDPTVLQGWKLISLLGYFSNDHPDLFAALLLRPPDKFFQHLVSLQQFVYYEAHHVEMQTLYRVVLFMMKRFPGQYGPQCRDLLIRILRYYPHLADAIANLLPGLQSYEPADPLVGIAPLHALVPDILQLLLSLEPPSVISKYLGLVRRIVGLLLRRHELHFKHAASERSQLLHMDVPTADLVLKVLFRCAGAVAFPDDVLGSNWRAGLELLDIARLLALAGLDPVSLVPLFSYVADAFDDVGVRDHADLYLQLATHCSPAQFRDMLTVSSDPLQQQLLSVHHRLATSQPGAALDFAPGLVHQESQFVTYKQCGEVIRLSRTLHAIEPRPWVAHDSALGDCLYTYSFAVDRDTFALLLRRSKRHRKKQQHDVSRSPTFHTHLTDPAALQLDPDSSDIPYEHLALRPPQALHRDVHQSGFEIAPATLVVHGLDVKLPNLEQLYYEHLLRMSEAALAAASKAGSSTKQPAPSPVAGSDDDSAAWTDDADAKDNPCAVKLQYFLFYDEDAESLLQPVAAEDELDESSSRRSGDAQFPRELFGVVVQPDAAGSYAPIHPVILPYLSHYSPSVHNDAPRPERFPFLYKFGMTLVPHAPLPTQVHCSVLFNDQHGNTCKGSLQPLSVHLHDLFLPLPIPDSLLDALTLRSARSLMFDLLWRTILLRTPDVFSDDELLSAYLEQRDEDDNDKLVCRECFESVRHIQIDQATAMQRLETKLSAFAVGHVSLDGDDEERQVEQDVRVDLDDALYLQAKRAAASGVEDVEEASPEPHVVYSVRLAVFLPPKYHLLLKVRVGPTATLIRFRSDNHTLLEHVDECLDQLLLDETR